MSLFALRVVVFASIVLAPINKPVADVLCASGEFANRHSAMGLEYALARVFKTGKSAPSDYVGTAFVIDAEKGLLLTARHVVDEAIPGDSILAEDRVDLSFPNIDSGRIKKAAIVDTFDPDRTIAREDFVDFNRDLALLKIDDSDLPQELVQLRLAFVLPRLPAQATVYSYYGAALTPLPSKGGISWRPHPSDAMRRAECTFSLSSMTDGGDSGAPVLSADGFVIGMVLQNFPKGQSGNKIALGLPSHCFRDDLVRAFQEILPERSVDVATQLIQMPSETLIGQLRLSPGGEDEITNIELFAGLQRLGHILAQSRESGLETHFTIEKFQCPISPAAYERLIWPLPRETLKQIFTHFAQYEQPREQADVLLRKASSAFADGHTALAVAFAQASSILYEIDIERSGLTMLLGPIPSGLDSATSTHHAQTFKGLSDSQLLIASAVSLDGTLDATPSYNNARLAALNAVRLAPDDQRELRGQAFAALATASLRLEQYEWAIEGYAFAAKNGVITAWARNNYDYAFSLKENKINIANDFNYRPPEQYFPFGGRMLILEQENFIARQSDDMIKWSHQ